MTIEYQMVLDNIAMFSYNPAVLPWHIRIIDGTVQVNDEGGMPELGVQWGGTPGFTRGVRAVRSITEQWGAHPVTDPLVVKTLQDVYRQAVGLAPEPDPPIFAKLVAAAPASRQAPTGASPAERADSAGVPAKKGDLPAPAGQPARAEDRLEDIARGTLYEDSPLARLRGQIEVPVGWFESGAKKDVPPNACFVGHYCDHYVWVMPDRVDGLSQFTLIILGITKHGVASEPTRGLAYVRH